MGKKKFDFTEDNKPAKTVDELFEEQFANRKPEDSSALPPDIPISLKDINAMVNAAAQADEGMIQEEVLEHVVDLEDEEGVYDLDEINEESLEEIEEELELEDEKKKKRKADREKGRKNEKAYQEKTRQMDEANRLHAEEMRKQSERIRQQEEANKAASVVASDEGISSTEKRNRALQEDEFEADRKAQVQAQKEKTDNIIAEQRAKEEAAKNYQGFENKNIDFSGRNEHGRKEDVSYSSETGKTEPVTQFKEEVKTSEYKEIKIEEPAQSTIKEVEHKPTTEPQTIVDKKEDLYKEETHREDYKTPVSDSYKNNDNYREPERVITPVAPININNESENQGSQTYSEPYESSSRRRDKQYMDEDYERAERAKSEARREQNRNLHSDSPASSQKQDNPSGTTTRNDYKSENEGLKKTESEKVITPIPSQDNRQSYQEGQTSSSKHNDESYPRRDIGRRAEVINKGSETNSFQKDDIYRNDYLEGSGNSSLKEKEPGKHNFERRTIPSGSENYQIPTNERQSDLPTGSQSEVRTVNQRTIREISRNHSQHASYRVGSGKDLDGAGNSIQVDKKDTTPIINKGYVSTVIGNGSNIEDSKESSFINRTTNYAENTIKGSEPKRTYVKEEPTFRQNRTQSDEVVGSGNREHLGIHSNVRKEETGNRHTEHTLKDTESRKPHIKEEPTFRQSEGLKDKTLSGEAVIGLGAQAGIKRHEDNRYVDNTLKNTEPRKPYIKEETPLRQGSSLKDKGLNETTEVKLGSQAGIKKNETGSRYVDNTLKDNEPRKPFIKEEAPLKQGSGLKDKVSGTEAVIGLGVQSGIKRHEDNHYVNNTLKNTEAKKPYIKEGTSYRSDKIPSPSGNKDSHITSNNVNKETSNKGNIPSGIKNQTPKNVASPINKDQPLDNRVGININNQPLNKPNGININKSRGYLINDKGQAVIKTSTDKTDKINSGLPVKTTSGIVVKSTELGKSKAERVKGNINSGNNHYGFIKPMTFSKSNNAENLKDIENKKLNPMMSFADRNIKGKQEKEYILTPDGKFVSQATVKSNWAKTMKKGFEKGTVTIYKNFGRQILNSFKENEAINAGDKVKVGLAGAFAIGAYMRVQRERLGVASNFIKAKGNSLANAGRFFKGADKKELCLVPHTAKQYDALLKKDKDLFSIEDKILKKYKKNLLKTKKTKGLTSAESKLLNRIENHLGLRKKKQALLTDKIKARRFKTALSLLSSAILSSGDTGAQTVNMALTTTRYFRGAYKVSKVSGKLAFKTAGFAFRTTGFAFRTTVKAGKFVNKHVPVVNKTTAKIVSSKPVQYVNGKVIRVKELKINYLKDKGATTIKGLVRKELNGGIYNKASQKTMKFLNQHEKLNQATKTIGRGVKFIGDKTGKINKGLNKVKDGAKKVGAVVSKPFKIIAKPFKAVGAAFNWIKGKVIGFLTIFTIVYCAALMLFSIGGLTTSMIFTDTDNLQEYVNSLNMKKALWMSQIETAQNQGGQKHGKYKEVTVNYVDENGNQIVEIGNMKEILSMVAVHIENDWPDWYEFIDSEKVDKLAKQLWDDSHKFETTEIGPYACDGCEERDYKCTDSLPRDASKGRIELHNQFASRGGCIEYQQDIKYFCSNDTANVDGTIVGNAHTQSYANTQMKDLYNTHNSKGGCTTVHTATSDHKPASGCTNYTTEKFLLSTLTTMSEWPDSVTMTWNPTTDQYEWDDGRYNWIIDRDYTTDTITYVREGSVHKYYGTRYICQDRKCNGHTTTVTRYRCDGHTEIYCPADHYDLIVNAIVIHLPKLYEVDSNSLGVVDTYPEGAAEGDFYWDSGNREWCENIYKQDWESTYEGLVGLESSTIAGTPLTEEEIQKYLEDIKDLNLSEDRLALLETALDAVGKIPYYWGGYATAPGFAGNNFGTVTTPDEDGRNLKGLDCSHFVDWVCWTALGDNLGNSWTGAIWNQSTAVSRQDLKPGDIGFQNEGGNSVNHVGFYLGNGLWVHCTASGDNVVVNSTTVFTLYRRLNIVND